MPEATTAPGVDFAELQAKARERLGQLEGRRAALALDSIRQGPEAAAAQAELEEVEGAIADAEVEIQRLNVAEAEHERRELVRVDQEEYERRRAALVEASEVADALARTAAKVDKGARAFAEAVAAYLEQAGQLTRLLQDAGQPEGAMVAQPSTFAIEAALSMALMDGGVSQIFDRLGYVSHDHRRPLAEVVGGVMPVVGIDSYISRLDASRATSAEPAP
jgi:hypothetical protein